MRLRQPTDFLILEALSEHGRNVATNLSFHTNKDRKNINTRLPLLEDYGLTRKIGPAKHSGLYELTREGAIALKHQDQYNEVDDFGALIEENLNRDTGSEDIQPNSRKTKPPQALVRGKGNNTDSRDN